MFFAVLIFSGHATDDLHVFIFPFLNITEDLLFYMFFFDFFSWFFWGNGTKSITIEEEEGAKFGLLQKPRLASQFCLANFHVFSREGGMTYFPYKTVLSLHALFLCFFCSGGFFLHFLFGFSKFLFGFSPAPSLPSGRRPILCRTKTKTKNFSVFISLWLFSELISVCSMILGGIGSLMLS